MKPSLPPDHDCKKCGCTPGSTLHRTEGGLCLGCGGCGDPECCGYCWDECEFETPAPEKEES